MKVLLLVFPHVDVFTGAHMDDYAMVRDHFGLTHLIDVIAAALCHNSECDVDRERLTEQALMERIGRHWQDIDPDLDKEALEKLEAERESHSELILAHLKQCVKDNQHVVPDSGYLRYTWACPHEENGVSKILVIAKHYHAKEYTDQAFPPPVVRELSGVHGGDS